MQLFGTPQIQYGTDRMHPVQWQKPVALLAYLACNPRWHSRDELLQILRPDVDEKQGRAYLRGLLHRTRGVFPKLSSLRVEGGRVCWSGHSDVAAFEAAVASRQWRVAVGLQRQSLLSGVGSTGEPSLDDWLEEERQRLRSRLCTALIGLIEDTRSGDEVDRTELMLQLADHDPLNEGAVQLLLAQAQTSLEMHVAAGAYRTLQRRLPAELGQEPSLKTQELYARLREKGPRAGP